VLAAKPRDMGLHLLHASAPAWRRILPEHAGEASQRRG
jgi:hypothetical protein